MKYILLLAFALIASAQSSITVVYSQATGRVRSIIVPARDVPAQALHLVPGEAVILIPKAPKQTVADVQESVSLATGLIPTGDRYAIVDAQGHVTGAILADPLTGDRVPGSQLIRSATAGPGWTWDPMTGFTPPPDQPHKTPPSVEVKPVK